MWDTESLLELPNPNTAEQTPTTETNQPQLCYNIALLVDTEFECYLSFTRNAISFSGDLQLLKTGNKTQDIVKCKQLSLLLLNYVGLLFIYLFIFEKQVPIARASVKVAK